MKRREKTLDRRGQGGETYNFSSVPGASSHERRSLHNTLILRGKSVVKVKNRLLCVWLFANFLQMCKIPHFAAANNRSVFSTKNKNGVLLFWQTLKLLRTEAGEFIGWVCYYDTKNKVSIFLSSKNFVQNSIYYTFYILINILAN